MFSHVIAGACFAFIAEKEAALEECFRVMSPGGRLCVANFFYCRTPQKEMLDLVEQVVGFQPSPLWSSNYWTQFFDRNFQLEHNETAELTLQTNEEIVIACHQAIQLGFRGKEYISEDFKKSCLERLYWTRLILNEHRRYQQYSVQVWSRRN